MSWTARDIPDQSGRVAVVTGANGGLGLETARELARAGAHVVMAARDQAKADAARGDLVGSVPDASVELVELTWPRWRRSGRARTRSRPRTTASTCW